MRAIKWVVINGALLACIVAGMVFGIEPAERVAMFAIWLFGCIWALLMFAPDERKRIRQRGHAVPLWLAGAVDLFGVLVLVATGWMFTGVVHAVAAIIEQGTFRDEGEQ